MALTVGIYEAKTQLPRLVSAVEESLEEIIITRHGRPVARLVPIRDDQARRDAVARLAALRGTFVGGPPTHEEIREWITEGRR